MHFQKQNQTRFNLICSTININFKMKSSKVFKQNNLIQQQNIIINDILGYYNNDITN